MKIIINGKVADISSGAGTIKLESIGITSPPAKTNYYAGESFDPTGMVVTGYYKLGVVTLDGTVTGYTISPAGPMPAGTTTVVITYSESGVTKTCEQPVSVVKRTVAVPAQSGSLTYNGQPQAPVWTGYDSSTMAKTETPRTDAGGSSTVFSLKDSALYQWTDGSTEDQNVTWTIAKAAGSLTVNPTSIALNKTDTTGDFTIGGNFDGIYTVESADVSVATVSLKSGKTYTVASVNNKNGTTSIKITCSGGTNYTVPAGKTVAVTAKFITIYGVEWDWTNSGPTKGVRTDAAAGFPDPNPAVNNGTGSSPFDSLMPWAGMVKETRAAGVMVKEPKYWFKWTKTGKKMKLQIADGPVEGFHVDPVNMDRGDGLGELDHSYVGRYHCASDNWKSETNKAPKGNITLSAARTGIHGLGENIWQFDFAQFWYIGMLILVEFANWDGQTTVGYGCSASGVKENTGKTDTMKYHTGTTAANRTTYGYVQYRNIEGYWDTVWDWVDGFYYKSNGLWITINPKQYADGSNGTLVGRPYSSGTGFLYPSEFSIPTVSGFEWALYPIAMSGSATTYCADAWRISDHEGKVTYCHGGAYEGRDLHSGPFEIYLCVNQGSQASSIGCRLWERPPKVA